MRGLHGAIALVICGPLLPPCASGQVEGTYRFVICEEECTSTDTAGSLASGEIVLFADSTLDSAIPDEVLANLRRQSFWLLTRDSSSNACFRVPHRMASVGGHELFAGIIREGLTRWEMQAGEIMIRLYQSPDGFFTVFGTLEGGGIRGRGEQAHGLDPKPPDRAFLAERIGPPDPVRCAGVGDAIAASEG